jgi:hypothetical protein
MSGRHSLRRPSLGPFLMQALAAKPGSIEEMLRAVLLAPEIVALLIALAGILILPAAMKGLGLRAWHWLPGVLLMGYGAAYELATASSSASLTVPLFAGVAFLLWFRRDRQPAPVSRHVAITAASVVTLGLVSVTVLALLSA